VVPSFIPTTFPSSQDQYCPAYPALGDSRNYTKCSMLVCPGANLMFELTTKAGNAFGFDSPVAELYRQNGQLYQQVSSNWNCNIYNWYRNIYNRYRNSKVCVTFIQSKREVFCL